MTQTEFYTQLGITKPYFYDILSGKTNALPPDKQIKACEILQLKEKERQEFFDIAAKARNEIPADITQQIDSNPKLIKKIRELLVTAN